MQLKTIKFAEYEGTPQEWVLSGLSLDSKNLIVGKNASGKTRILNVIGALAKNLAGLQSLGLFGNYECQLQHEGKAYSYALKFEDQQIVFERLLINDRPYLDRGVGGIGTIWSEKIGEGTEIPFQAPTSELAAVVRRDSIQTLSVLSVVPRRQARTVRQPKSLARAVNYQLFSGMNDKMLLNLTA